MNLTHLGTFNLPAGLQSPAPGLPLALIRLAKFGFGGQAVCLDGPDSLWVSGNEVGDLVARVKIPDTLDDNPTAVVDRPFRELAPTTDLKAQGLNNLVGITVQDGTLYGLYNLYYDVSGTDGGRKSLWDGGSFRQLGDGRLKTHAGYITTFDDSLWVGRSSGAGNIDIPHGPILYRVGLSWSLEKVFQHTRPDWTPADRYTGVAFLPGHVVWLVSKDVNKQTWYGTGTEVDSAHRAPPEWFTPAFAGDENPDAVWESESEWRAAWKEMGIVDLWSDSKGYHTTGRDVWLLPYTWPGLEELPPIRLQEFHESGKCGGLAFDPGSGRLYIHEAWPPVADGNSVWERPRVHVYAVSPAPTRPTHIPVSFTFGGRTYYGMVKEVVE